ncbi:MAG: mobile mystery protein A [Gammaproteobacteria bacterium]|jgi:predicted DNA-binding mobile mystery protein A|nr:DNA-binding protein [Chromatiales bacterium]MDP6675173.1 mobile mystery protein A [Gammaproteobacteria bacterium]
MRAQERVLARKNIDKRLIELRNSQGLIRPPRGWIKAIREALGMNSKQLAKRMGVSQPRASEIEKNEVVGSLTLDTLQRAANALECQLVYAFIPREPLQDLVEERANKLARTRLQATSHSMALEDQSIDEADAQSQLNDLIKKLAENEGSVLWEEE